MGRIAGVTAAETRERLLRAAADVFAERGYDGTRVADIAAAAGVSNGALYAHFASKADLLVAALRAHGRRMLADMFAADPDRPVMDLLLASAGLLPRRERRPRLPHHRGAGRGAPGCGRRPADARLHGRAGRLAGGADANWLRPAANSTRRCLPAALAHFCLLLAMGSALVTPDLHAVGEPNGPRCWPRHRRPSPKREPRRDHARDHRTGRTSTVKVQIDPERCQGHGRCYDLVPDLFGEDEEGSGRCSATAWCRLTRSDEARLAVANCPERAIDLLEEN